MDKIEQKKRNIFSVEKNTSCLTKYSHVWLGIVMSDQVQSCLTRYSHVEPGIIMSGPGIIMPDPGIIMSDQV